MQKVITGFGLIVLAAAGWLLYGVFGGPAVFAPAGLRDDSGASVLASVVSDRAPAGKPGAGPDAAASPPVAVFIPDFGRLHDPAYAFDPELVRFAEANDISAQCLLAQVRFYVEGASTASACDVDRWVGRHDSLHILPGVYEEVCRTAGGEVDCRTERVAEHPFEKYADHELESLAVSFPEAAVLLARRSSDPAVSERYYEQAVALSGRPGPLLEWMQQRRTGGLEFVDSALDLEKAALGYEIYLTTSAFEHGAHAAGDYASALQQAGVDLAPIQRRAEERLHRLQRLRVALVGNGWEED
ncbi:MAG: hypothetical protein AAGF72_18345 [Pseudomonadota bacterium]